MVEKSKTIHELFKKETCNYISAYVVDEVDFRSRGLVKVNEASYDYIVKKIGDFIDGYVEMYFNEFDNLEQMHNRCFSKIIRCIQNLFDFWDDGERSDLVDEGDEIKIEERNKEKNKELLSLVDEELYTFYLL